MADQFIKTGMYKNILVIGSENHSGGLERSTRGRGVTVIFGDGAELRFIEILRKRKDFIFSLTFRGKYARELMLDGPATEEGSKFGKNNSDDVSYYPYKRSVCV